MGGLPCSGFIDTAANPPSFKAVLDMHFPALVRRELRIVVKSDYRFL
jgi:hypothetical protein